MSRALHRADSRGLADHGWLRSRHTFSFAGYHNPARMGFGLLRVLNDDRVASSQGFSTHPHKDMEIISLPLSGSLRHQDNMGNKHVIRAGEVQLMSAGSGITHSEYNNSDIEEVNFLQIWVMPKALNIKPRYDQREVSCEPNNFCLIVGPMGRENVVNINQDAYFSLAKIDAGKTASYQKYDEKNGLYFFVLRGSVEMGSEVLRERDGLGIEGESKVKLAASEPAEVLCMEVPMGPRGIE